MASQPLAALIAVISCAGLPWLCGLFSTLYVSPEAQIITVLERQLQRCGPENQTCPPCITHSTCGWSTLAANGILGLASGLLTSVATGSVVLLFYFRRASTPQQPVDTPPRGGTFGQLEPSSPIGSPSRRLRPAVPLAILSADQIRDL